MTIEKLQEFLDGELKSITIDFNNGWSEYESLLSKIGYHELEITGVKKPMVGMLIFGMNLHMILYLKWWYQDLYIEVILNYLKYEELDTKFIII